MKKILIFVLIFVLALSLGVSACGGGGNDDSTSGTSDANEFPVDTPMTMDAMEGGVNFQPTRIP